MLNRLGDACDSGRMSSDQIQREVLKRAAEIAGGEDELSKRLNCKTGGHAGVVARQSNCTGWYLHHGAGHPRAPRSDKQVVRDGG